MLDKNFKSVKALLRFFGVGSRAKGCRAAGVECLFALSGLGSRFSGTGLIEDCAGN